jgi:hypothetical protein
LLSAIGRLSTLTARGRQSFALPASRGSHEDARRTWWPQEPRNTLTQCPPLKETPRRPRLTASDLRGTSRSVQAAAVMLRRVSAPPAEVTPFMFRSRWQQPIG